MKVLCCLGIRTVEIHGALLIKNFQVSKALVLAAKNIPLSLPI